MLIEQRNSHIANKMRVLDGASWIDKMVDSSGENEKIPLFSLEILMKIQNEDYKGKNKELRI